MVELLRTRGPGVPDRPAGVVGVVEIECAADDRRGEEAGLIVEAAALADVGVVAVEGGVEGGQLAAVEDRAASHLAGARYIPAEVAVNDDRGADVCKARRLGAVHLAVGDGGVIEGERPGSCRCCGTVPPVTTQFCTVGCPGGGEAERRVEARRAAEARGSSLMLLMITVLPASRPDAEPRSSSRPGR